MAAKMAAVKRSTQNQGKRTFSNVLATRGRSNPSPVRKQRNDESIESAQNPSDEHIAGILMKMIDTKLEELRQTVWKQWYQLRWMHLKKNSKIWRRKWRRWKRINESLNHVEQVLTDKIQSTWEYAVRNEQYSRKNNVRIFGLQEERDENLEERVITFAKEYVNVEVKPEEVEIVHRIGAIRAGASRSNKQKAVIVKFVSNKTKMKLLTERRLLKVKGFAVMEDMAPDIAKRLKELKETSSVEDAWLSKR